MIKIKKVFSIGEVSKIKDITIKALRYYHKVGILVPKYIDENNGYRYYTIDQFIHIDIIKGCRELGTSIAELQEIFKECDTDKLMEFLQLKKQEAEANIYKLKNIIKNIDLLSSSVKQSKEIVKNNAIAIEDLKERVVVVARCKEAGSLGELMYYSDLDKIINDKNLDTSMDRGIIYKLNSDGQIEPSYVFNGIEDIYKVEDKSYIKILPKGKYLTLIYNKDNIDEKRKEIINYIKENKLEFKTIIETEIFNDIFNTDDYNCQIQILIEEY